MSRILDGRYYRKIIDSLESQDMVCSLLADTVQRCIDIIDYKMPSEWDKMDYGRQVAEGAVRDFRNNTGHVPSSTAHWYGYKGPNLFCITFGGLILQFSTSWTYDFPKAKLWLGEALAVEASAYDADYQEAIITDQLDWLQKKIGEA